MISLFTDKEETQVITCQDTPTSKGHNWDLSSGLSGNPSSSILLTSWYWLLQVTVSRLMGHLECEALTEQWANSVRKALFAGESGMISGRKR